MIGKPPAAPAPASASPDPAAFAEAHRRLIADNSIQFEMQPVEPPQQVQFDGSGLAAFIRAIWPVVEVLFWVGVAALAGFLLYLLVLRLSGAEMPWKRRKAAAEESWRPQDEPARALLNEADALAARGLFSEAAHLLLFRSIEDIEGRRPDAVRPALTSRDIAALPAIPERPRSAFARIAMLVERSLFARRPLDEGDWRAARAAYEEFAFAGAWA